MSRFLSPEEKKRLQLAMCYVKNLVASLAAENSEKKVYQRRFFPILQRVLPFRLQGLETFFQSHQQTLVAQFVEMMTVSGEIVHLGDGYYLVPPPRQVIFPVSGIKVAISNLQEPNGGTPGLFGQSPCQGLPEIMLDDWAFAEKPTELFNRYEKELDHEPQFRPHQWFDVHRNQFRLFTNETLLQHNVTYLMTTQHSFKKGQKVDWFIGRMTSNGWYVAKIEREHKQRILFGVCLRTGKSIEYSWVQRGHCFELRLSRSIPLEERVMLSVIGLPESWPNPKRYLISAEYIDDAQWVLKRLQMTEVKIDE